MNPLQDPRLRAHVSASLYLMDSLQDPCLRIHVSDSCLSVHRYGSFARPMSPDPCLSVLFSGSSARSMSSDSCLSIFVSQVSLQDPCLRIHVSASSYLRILCAIHVSDSWPRIRQNRSSTRPMSSDSCLSMLHCKIHVSGFISQHLCISVSSTRTLSSDSCLNIFVSQGPLTKPCLRFMA